MNIEQRALELIAGNELLRKNTPKVRGAIRDALIQIATEQKAEDINKACKWVEWAGGNLHLFIISESRQANYSVFLQEFRKAMEDNGLKDATGWIDETEYILAHEEEYLNVSRGIIRLLDYMKEHNLSKKDIAGIAGVDERLVHKLVHGQLNVEIIKLMED